MTTTRHHASTHVVAVVLAAAWRENLANIRTHAHTKNHTTTIQLPHATISFTATHHAFNHITPRGPITTNNTPITTPETLLHLLTQNPPPHLLHELNDAITGLSTALDHHNTNNATLNQQAHKHHAPTTIDLATALTTHTTNFLPCRFYEPLAVHGHHLHPLARTRLGWTTHDRNRYDLETSQTFPIRFVAAKRETVDLSTDTAKSAIDTQLAQHHPQLSEHLDPDHVLIPIHPWQYHNVIKTRHTAAFDSGALTDLPHLQIAATPTASIRTLLANSGIYLKCSLDIHITSTRRGISPATAKNGPELSTVLTKIINNDTTLKERITILKEHASVSLPADSPHPRDLTCILRQPLSTVLRPDEHGIPATALPARSPISGHSILTELIDRLAHHTTQNRQAAAKTFLHRYSDLLATSTMHLAGHYGIAAEAHLQNSIPTFDHTGMPQRIIIRDFGGARIHLPRLHAAQHHPPLHPHTVTTTHDINTMRDKIAYTVFQNHLAALINNLSLHGLIESNEAWDIVTDIVTTADIPIEDTNYYTAPTAAHKALLTMRLRETGDHHISVTNPMHKQ